MTGLGRDSHLPYCVQHQHCPATRGFLPMQSLSRKKHHFYIPCMYFCKSISVTKISLAESGPMSRMPNVCSSVVALTLVVLEVYHRACMAGERTAAAFRKLGSRPQSKPMLAFTLSDLPRPTLTNVLEIA